jgi:hypothetical protein
VRSWSPGCGVAANAAPVPAGTATKPTAPAGASAAGAALAPRREDGEALVTVSIPLVALLGVAVFLAWRYMGLRIWQVIVCLLFGFFLAATTAAPEIHHLVTAIVRLITGSRS